MEAGLVEPVSRIRGAAREREKGGEGESAVSGVKRLKSAGSSRKARAVAFHFFNFINNFREKVNDFPQKVNTFREEWNAFHGILNNLDGELNEVAGDANRFSRRSNKSLRKSNESCGGASNFLRGMNKLSGKLIDAAKVCLALSPVFLAVDAIAPHAAGDQPPNNNTA